MIHLNINRNLFFFPLRVNKRTTSSVIVLLYIYNIVTHFLKLSGQKSEKSDFPSLLSLIWYRITDFKHIFWAVESPKIIENPYVA